MSSSVLCGRAGLVIRQTAGLQAITALRLGRTRTFSASSDEPYVAVSHPESGPSTVWPDENMGPFGPQDRRFQLPGNVGFDCHLEGVGGEAKLFPPHRTVPDLLSAPCSSERHEFILAQFVSDFQTKEAKVSLRMRKAELYFDQMTTDCSVNSCPELLRKDLDLYFPAVPTGGITVVSVRQRGERPIEAQQTGDQLLDQFVSGAKEMCFGLWTAGYWADFIDPMTGAAFFGSALPATAAAGADGRHLGFQIEASGSCTVISPVLKGTRLFVGSVFTNAPTYSPTIARLRGLENTR